MMNDLYLNGMTLYAMGDSYFAGNKIGKDATWVNMFCRNHGINFINYGIGGSTMSDFVTDKNPMIKRIMEMDTSPADIILLEGGRNDLNNEVPLGALDSRDTQTFCGAVNFILDRFRKTYPNALIILITPWKFSKKRENGYNNLTYAELLRSIAEHRADRHITCIYNADPEISGVDMDDPDFRAKYSIKPNDPSHLNEEGMKLVLPFMEQKIEEAIKKFHIL